MMPGLLGSVLPSSIRNPMMEIAKATTINILGSIFPTSCAYRRKVCRPLHSFTIVVPKVHRDGLAIWSMDLIQLGFEVSVVFAEFHDGDDRRHMFAQFWVPQFRCETPVKLLLVSTCRVSRCRFFQFVQNTRSQ